MIAGIDFSSRAVDVVLLDEDSDRAVWHRFGLEGQDAFERTRSVGASVPGRASAFWDDVRGIGIELPFGPNKGVLRPVLGAILSTLPGQLMVKEFTPSEWRKAVGLSGRASKDDVKRFAVAAAFVRQHWPQDACDAYAIALATRSLLQKADAA